MKQRGRLTQRGRRRRVGTKKGKRTSHRRLSRRTQRGAGFFGDLFSGIGSIFKSDTEPTEPTAPTEEMTTTIPRRNMNVPDMPELQKPRQSPIPTKPNQPNTLMSRLPETPPGPAYRRRRNNRTRL